MQASPAHSTTNAVGDLARVRLLGVASRMRRGACPVKCAAVGLWRYRCVQVELTGCFAWVLRRLEVAWLYYCCVARNPCGTTCLHDFVPMTTPTDCRILEEHDTAARPQSGASLTASAPTTDAQSRSHIIPQAHSQRSLHRICLPPSRRAHNPWKTHPL